MKISEVRKIQALSSFLYAVAHISDKKHQKQAWIENIDSKDDSFDETYIAIEEGEFILKNWEEFGFSESQKTLFVKFRNLFLGFGKDKDWTPSLIDTPEWTNITKMATEVLQNFLNTTIHHAFKLSPNLDKKNYLNHFLNTVYCISSKEYQQRVWIDAIGPEVDDFDETCIYFDDCNTILAHSDKFELSEDQKNILKKFREEFDKFSDENDWPPFFIDTPEWTRITEMAKDVLRAFNYTPS